MIKFLTLCVRRENRMSMIDKVAMMYRMKKYIILLIMPIPLIS